MLTAEALIRVSKFDKMLTSIMGIEGKFLLRIGDAVEFLKTSCRWLQVAAM